MDEDESEFRREVGAELRRYRRARGWTRGQLADEMSRPINIRTLESIETGQRDISTYRLVQICRTLRINPLLPICAATERLGMADPADIRVDLRAVLRDTSDELIPLRGWAMIQLENLPPSAIAVTHLTPSAVEPLAALCDLPVETLARRLAEIATPRRHHGGAR